MPANLERLPWTELHSSLRERGYARAESILTSEECAHLIELYPREDLFRNRVDMQRFRFGIGDYQYFSNPLPPMVEHLRRAVYPHLAVIANEWAECLGQEVRYPAHLDEYLAQCHAAGQCKPTPLLLHYETGGYNCLHQDLYGELAFPLQMVCMLSQPEADHTGGEFLLVEQRPRAQSIGHAVRPNKGDAVFFTTRYRPVKGARGYYRANVRHGVSPVLSGSRYTLGVIFHDAK